MPGAATITQFQGQTPPWSLIQLDANFTAVNALLKDVGNYTPYIADAGGANAYACTYGVGLTYSLATGAGVVFKAANANTGASTLNVNATGIKNILNVDGSALSANQIVANGIYHVVYDGTQYQLQNPTQGIVNRNAVITGSLTVNGQLSASGGTHVLRFNSASATVQIAGTTNGGLLYALNAADTVSAGYGNRKAWVGSGVDGAIVAANTGLGIDMFVNGSTTPTVTVSSAGAASFAGTLGVTGVSTFSSNGVHSFGGGGTGATVPVVRLDGGSAAGGGSYIKFSRNSSDYDFIGTESGIIGNNSNDFALYSASTNIKSYALGLEALRVVGVASGARFVTISNAVAAGRASITTNAGNIEITSNNGETILSGSGNVYVQPDTATNNALTRHVNTGGTGFVGLDSNGGGLGGQYTLNLWHSGNYPVILANNNAEKARVAVGGFSKFSNDGTYRSATSLTHEFRNNQNTNTWILEIEHNAATATNQNGIFDRLAGDPNNTTNFFLQCTGNATERATLRGNGGLANFSANNVNLSDLSVKRDFTPLAEIPGMLDAMWDAHRELDWARYRYKDQTHEEWNYGPSAQSVHELFTAKGMPLTDAWQPAIERVHAGALTIAGLSYDYEIRQSEPNPDSPLGITGDFAYVTGAMVSYAQKRIERIEQALRRAKISL